MQARPSIVALLLLACLPVAAAASGPPPECVYVSSYHVGYSWSDRLEQGLRTTLGARCRLMSIYLDTKRQREPVERRAAAARAMVSIREIRPAVIITSDDNAARYLIVPHLKGAQVPVVFTGVNWTVEEYGFPWPNVTGIVEVSPIRAVLEQAERVVGRAGRAAYIAANTQTEWKNYARLKRETAAMGTTLFAMLVDNMVQYEASVASAQGVDILIMGGNAGIRDWDAERARRIAQRHTATFSITTRDWMMPYTMLGLTKLPEEHGEWAGESVIAILDGRSPATIPLATNRHWESWVNQDLLERGGYELPARTLRKARHVASH